MVFTNTNQIQTLKTPKFLRYESCSEILSELDVKQFQQSFDTCKIVVSLLEIFKSSLLYIEV